jgi:hypothetical protein
MLFYLTNSIKAYGGDEGLNIHAPIIGFEGFVALTEECHVALRR